jgi:hypothetical protein
MDTEFERVQYYVGNPGENYFIVGRLQLELLQRNGCTPDSHVLEIGRGCLGAGRPIIQFLNAERYVGLEPNVWLLDAVLGGPPDTRGLFAKLGRVVGGVSRVLQETGSFQLP